MVDETVINRLLQIIQSHCHVLEAKQKDVPDFARFKASEYDQKAIQHYLQEMIQACIDIGNHIVAYEQLGNPENYREIFELLTEKGVISKQLSEKMVRMVGFRNIVIHLYEKVDLETVYNAFQKGIADFSEFTKEIRIYLKS